VRLITEVRRGMKIVVCLCLVFSMLYISTISAEETLDSLVDATITVEFVTGTNLKINTVLDVQRINVFDTVYDNAEIQNIASTNLEILGAIKLSLRNLLKNQIETSFDGAIVTAINQIPEYQNNLFYDEFAVDLVSSYFGLNDSANSETLVNGFLDMGAVVEYNFNFVTEPGWNNTFTCVLPNSISFKSANTDDVSLNTKEITWTLNWNGVNSEIAARLSTRYKNPTTTGSETEDIFLTFDLDSSNVDNVSLSTVFSLRTINIQGYNVLPDFVTELDFVPSDGIRLFIDNDLLLWDGFYEKTIKPIEITTISTIESSSFNQSLSMLFNWDAETSTNCTTPYNTTNMDAFPAIKAVLTSVSPIDLLFCDVSSRAFFGLINAGGVANISEEDVNFGDRLFEIGQSYEVLLQLPNDVYLDGDNIYRWNESILFSGVFSSDLQPLPNYSEEVIETYIEIDMSKLDLNIPSFFTGKTEFTATTRSKEDIRMFVTVFPMEFNLSDKINLPYLNSDAFRICVEESVFFEEEVDGFLSNKKALFETRMSRVLSGLTMKGVVDKDVFSDSLSWDKDISHMDAVVPVIASNYANNLYPVNFGLSFWPPGTHISNQTFIFESIKNQSVTYRIVFPKGISVQATDTLNKSILKGETTDGREYIEVFFASDEEGGIDTITCVLVASSLYMLGQFLPCIISFVLVLILVMIIYMFRKKRRGKKLVIQEEVDTSGYEGEDFYVPPPPSSKK